MSKYRISVSIDGKNFFWVVVDRDRFIRNPTKEDLIGTRLKYYNKTNICDRCREKNRITDNSILYTKNALKEYDENGKWLEIWDCRNCWQKYDSNSGHNKLKLETDCRNNNLDPNSEVGIGYITSTLVKKFLEIKDCFDITGNFNYPGYDMIEHEDWGLVDAKGSSLLTKDGYLYHCFGIRKNKKADFFFCIGFDKDRKHVIAVYIIPNEEDISKLDAISIPYGRDSKYNKYKESEEEVKKWDDLFHTMKLDNCPVLKNL